MADHDAQRVDVITPEGPAFEGEAEIVVVPGTAGQLGILAHHAPLISSLKPGEMHVTDMEGTRHEWATDGGFWRCERTRRWCWWARRCRATASTPARLGHGWSGHSRARRAREGDGDIYRAEREAAFAEVSPCRSTSGCGVRLQPDPSAGRASAGLLFGAGLG